VPGPQGPVYQLRIYKVHPEEWSENVLILLKNKNIVDARCSPICTVCCAMHRWKCNLFNGRCLPRVSRRICSNVTKELIFLLHTETKGI
jgi:hypothetical protein